MSNRRPARRPSFVEPLVAGLLALGVAGAAGAVFLSPEGAPARTYAVVVVDASGTSAADGRCADVARIGEALVALGTPLDAWVLQTGEAGRAARELGRAGYVPSGQVLEGKGADAARREAFHEALRKACAAVEATQESPIFAASASAVDRLRGLGCGEGRTACGVWVRTDGWETSDATVKAALTRGKPRQPRIENTGVDVHLCGLGERASTGRKRAPNLDAVRAAFAPEFTEPDRVSFAEACEPFGPGR